MAILSAEEIYSNEQAITGDAASTNIIDHGLPGTWIHATTPIVDDKGTSMICLGIQVTEDFNTLTSLTIEFQTDTVENFASPTTIYSETILLADLVAGKKTAVRVIPFNTDQQFTRVNYDVNGTNPTTGKITAGIVQLESAWGSR
ncbi:MAG: hypothetical protein JKY93_12390 [Gammaproteobacteria bacterium]|nr:hypothetical protein [Gammaproteobacteria bacterium]